jgi:predicted lactoylglutathione lyase
MEMALASNMIFVNLPVKDLDKSMAFFREVGFEFNMEWSNEDAACMVISEHIYAMLLTESHFQKFIRKEIADTSRTSEAIISLTAESRAKVDEIIETAFAAGAKATVDTSDHGFMYTRSFEDIDGHLWEVFHMDLAATAQGQDQGSESAV